MGETLTSLPWFYTYIIARARQVKSVYDLCARKGVPPPSPHEISFWDSEAVLSYIKATEQESHDFERGSAIFYGG